jgi:hypothetical protein
VSVVESSLHIKLVLRNGLRSGTSTIQLAAGNTDPTCGVRVRIWRVVVLCGSKNWPHQGTCGLWAVAVPYEGHTVIF